MSVAYSPISWNKFKKKYDLFLWISIRLYFLIFILLNKILFPQLILVTILIRGFGLLAIILLHIILMIGPLCRLQPKFLPLLYNRRHLGVTMFFITSVHAILSLVWFHSGGNVHPLVSLFAGNTYYGSLRFFPFQTLGFAAYLIFMMMAFTSHDFWLNFLSPKIWKAIHMVVYLAYGLIVMHVVLGVVQLEDSPVIFSMLMIGLATVSTLHILSGYKEWKFDKMKRLSDNNWVYVCLVNEIQDTCAKMAVVNNERVAIFKYGNKLSAVHNVCKHQNGPLGEGKIVDGCIICPWHGYQYQPGDGCAPAPFTEKLATYNLKVEGQAIYINTKAMPEGTAVDPIVIAEQSSGPLSAFFIGWSDNNPTSAIKFVRRSAIGIIALSLVVALGFTVEQRHIALSSFDYKNLKLVQGQLIEYPFPAIRSVTGKDVFGRLSIKTYPLINNDKFGADGVVDSIRKRYNTDKYIAEIRGAFIMRNKVTAMELAYRTSSIKILDKNNGLPPGELRKLCDTAIFGEIIDPKCYFGAMNPGEGKPHRSCAILCISGGIMPMLAFKDIHGQSQYAVLLGQHGEKINTQVIKFVAEPLRIIGTLFRYDNWYVFYTDPVKEIAPLFK
jgi:sulfoxide reductase heme-binding subunit YedZ